MNDKKLYKSESKMLCGVCGGVAEYFEMDPTIARVLFAMMVLIGGVGVFLYFVLAIIIPKKEVNKF